MKPEIRITLLGRFVAQFRAEVILDHLPNRKILELLAYLLLNPGRAHPREALAELLWGECESPHSRKYLRQALWQLHAGLLAVGRERASRLIHQEPGWVELHLDRNVHVDTVELERAFNAVRGVTAISRTDAVRVTEAIQLYRGDLLQGCSRPWCVYERDRYRRMYLTLLDKLVTYHRERQEYEAGIAFGTLALQCDGARERTHQGLITLRLLAGDRTGALRQYGRCVEALRTSLDVTPSPETQELFKSIRNGESPDRLAPSTLLVVAEPEASGPSYTSARRVDGRSNHRKMV